MTRSKAGRAAALPLAAALWAATLPLAQASTPGALAPDFTVADAAGKPWLGRDWTDAEGHCWTELSLERLAGDERFLAVNR